MIFVDLLTNQLSFQLDFEARLVYDIMIKSNVSATVTIGTWNVSSIPLDESSIKHQATISLRMVM